MIVQTYSAITKKLKFIIYINIYWVSDNHRRRIELEGKGRHVGLGDRILTAIAVLPWSFWNKRLNSNVCFKKTETKQLVRQWGRGRVEWFSTFLWFSKSDTFLPTRYNFRNLIFKNQFSFSKNRRGLNFEQIFWCFSPFLARKESKNTFPPVAGFKNF